MAATNWIDRERVQTAFSLMPHTHRPIVVGTCGNWNSSGAVRFAQLLEQRDGTPVYVAGVVDNATLVGSPLDSRRDGEDTHTAEGLLKRIENQLVAVGVPDGQWPVNVVVGRHADALGDMARAGGASLLLV